MKLKKKFLAVLSGLLILSSISYSAAKTQEKENLVRTFKCGYQDVTVENLSTSKVRLADGYGGIYELKATKSASGEKYKNKNISIHIKNDSAIYTEKGIDKSCTLEKTEYGSIKL